MANILIWFVLIVLSAIIDSIIGDPFGAFHPVVLIGKLIAFLRKRLNRGKHRKIKGLILIVLTLSATAITVIVLEYVLLHLNYYLYLALNLWFLATSLAQKSLLQAGEQVKEALERGNLKKAREFTGYIVGRDTSSLSRLDIIRATVETIAENGIDGIIAPLFFMLLGLISVYFSPLLTPLLTVYLYKSINTMDSMVGYIDEPYTEFGYCAAKLDDFANFFPARLGARLYLLAGKILNLNLDNAQKIYKRDRSSHDSPNAGHPESVVAGLLEIQLGGDNIYFGNVHKKARLGDKFRDLDTSDITSTMSIVNLSEVLLLILAGIVVFCIFLIKIVLFAVFKK